MLDYGLWDEIRVDQGKEWVLCLFVQEKLAPFRTNQERPPHLQSTSTMVCTFHCIHFSVLAGKPAFGKLPCSGATMMACWRLSADASMLCHGALMSAGQYAGICNVMCAWHVSMQGGALSRLYHYYIAWSASKWSTC